MFGLSFSRFHLHLLLILSLAPGFNGLETASNNAVEMPMDITNTLAGRRHERALQYFFKKGIPSSAPSSVLAKSPKKSTKKVSKWKGTKKSKKVTPKSKGTKKNKNGYLIPTEIPLDTFEVDTISMTVTPESTATPTLLRSESVRPVSSLVLWRTNDSKS